MLKKIALLTMLCLGVFILYIIVYDNNRFNEIIKSELGDNFKNLEKIDEDLSIGGPISIETYIFKIKNKNAVNCDMDSNFTFSQKKLIHYEKKYIHADNGYCEKYTTDEYNRTIKVIIQSDILVLNVFVD